MKKLKLCLVLGIACLIFPGLSFSQTVTFQVDMSVQQTIGNFNPDTDIVVVRGDFNGWAGNDAECTDGDGDGVYVGEVDFSGQANGSFGFKYVVVPGSGDDMWEGDPNRSLEYQGTDLVLDVVFFDRVDMAGEWRPYIVAFSINMGVQIDNGNFDPSVDNVVVTGDHAALASWTPGSAPTLSEDINNPGVYQTVVEFDSLMTNVPRQFKFVIVKDDETIMWEDLPSGGNRMLTPQDDDPDVNPPDGVYELIYDPASDGDGCDYFACADIGSILQQDVTVTFKVDISSVQAWFDMGNFLIDSQTLGDTLWSMDDFEHVYVNGNLPLTPSWGGWGSLPIDYQMTLEGNLIYSVDYLFTAGQSKVWQYKYGLDGLDNEAGFAENHLLEIDDTNSTYLVEDCFGAQRTDLPDWPECETFTAIEDTDDPIVSGKNDFILYQSRPNPARSATTIAFQLPTPGDVTLSIYNAAGQLVRAYELGQQSAHTVHNVTWDTKDNRGDDVAGGIYFYKLESDGQQQTRKMVLLK